MADASLELSPRRLLVVEDDPRVLALITTEAECLGWSVASATTLGAARSTLSRASFSAAIVDLGLPDGSGLSLLPALAAAVPPVPSLVLTIDEAPERVLSAIRAGASGYLLKEDLLPRLGSALDDCLAGRMPLSPAAARAVVARVRSEEGGPVEAVLTEAERRVLALFSQGHSYATAGTALGVTENTVRSYVRSIYAKLEVGTKTEAVLAAMRRGLI